MTCLFLASIWLRLFAGAASTACGQPPFRARVEDRRLPVYSVVVALHREARVVPQLVAALAAIDYPRGKLDIKLVIEHDDRATRLAIVALDLPATYEIVIACIAARAPIPCRQFEPERGGLLPCRSVAHDHVDVTEMGDGLGLTIPYEWYNVDRSYEPDYLVRLATPATEAMELTVVLEIKGMLTEEDKAKHEAARRWVAAVNNWGKLGRWAFHVCRDPQMLERELSLLLDEHQESGMTGQRRRTLIRAYYCRDAGTRRLKAQPLEPQLCTRTPLRPTSMTLIQPPRGCGSRTSPVFADFSVLS